MIGKKLPNLLKDPNSCLEIELGILSDGQDHHKKDLHTANDGNMWSIAKGYAALCILTLYLAIIFAIITY